MAQPPAGPRALLGVDTGETSRAHGRSPPPRYERLLRLHPSASEGSNKGPLGLTTLFQPADTPPIAQVIFVHGLDGGSEHTWSKNGVFWPRDLLPQEDPFQMTAIHSFGYNANFKRSSILRVEDFSNSLLQGMSNNPIIQATESPIVLVAHSMGGLVIKQAYILAKRDATFATLAARIQAMFFLATPHTGSSLAPVLDRIFRLSSGSKPYLDDLKSNSEAVQSINKDFPWAARNLPLTSFFETNRLSLGGLRDVMIVPKEDAILQYPHEKTQLLYGDHRSICKYDNPKDHNFIAVWQALVACFKELHLVSAPAAEQEDPDGDAMEILSDNLGVSEPPADDLVRIATDRLPGTCQWLTASDEFRKWQRAPSSKVFWVRSPPGSGKSHVAAYAIETLQSLPAKCCYYFFNHADTTKASMDNFLRSMAWQMASMHSDVKSRLLQICERDRNVGKAGDYRTLQRKLWEQGIFQEKLQQTTYWVIDAFDECASGQDLAKFFARVQEKTDGAIKIFTTTRNVYNEYSLNPDGIVARDIMIDDIQADIAKYLDANRQQIPGASAEERQALKNLILERSNGCFLWAILVLQRLSKTVGAQARLRALEELPPGMNQLYSRIIDSMSDEEKEVSMTILTWVICAVRPLTTLELKAAVEQMTMDKIDDIETIVSRHCHDLVYVDKDGRVRIRHASARNFLLRHDINSEFRDDLTIQETEAHKTLAMACLDYLVGPEMKMKPKRRMVVSAPPQRSVFVNYACKALPEHVNKSKALDADITASLNRFLQTNVLSWIEYLANVGDLETVLQFAQVLHDFLRRKSRAQLLLGEEVVIIDSWATDLVRLISMFGRQILASPEAALTLVPAFCPPDSAPYVQFGKVSGVNISVLGLGSRDWDECLCTVVLSDPKPTASGAIPRERLHSLAACEDHFCIGTSTGRISVFDDHTYQESRVIEHSEPVILVCYATSQPLLASASRKRICIWNTHSWQQQWDYTVKQNCLAMAFVDDDKLLLVVLSNSTLLAMNLVDRVVEEICWIDMLDEAHRDVYRNLSPQFVSFNTHSGLLAVSYRSRRLLVYNYERESYQIFDHKEGLFEGETQGSAISVYALEFSNLPDSSLLAVSYSSSDLVLFDTDMGTINVSVSKNYFSSLVSSPDGRTLAAASRDGTVELYDFETLQKLYRIRSDGRAVSVMQFTASSTRLLIIRAGGQDCRVWCPTTLYRRDLDNSSVRSPSLGSGSSDGVLDDPETTVNHITALGRDPGGSFFFVGKVDHSVSVYDTKTGSIDTILFSHHDILKSLHSEVFGGTQIVFSVDNAGILMAHSIKRTRQAWNVQHLYSHRGPVGGLHQLLCGSRNILLCYADQTSILDATTGAEITKISNPKDSPETGSTARWLLHPSDPDLLLYVTATNITIREWSSLELGTSVTYQLESTGSPTSDLRLYRATTLFTGSNLTLLVTLINPPYGPRGPFTHVCYPATPATFGTSSEDSMLLPLQGTNTICYCIDSVLGTYRERLVFLHKDGWICTVKAAAFHGNTQDISDLISHHFAPPSDWLLASKMLVQITKFGDVLFVVRGEVALVKRGLESTVDIKETRLIKS